MMTLEFDIEKVVNDRHVPIDEIADNIEYVVTEHRYKVIKKTERLIKVEVGDVSRNERIKFFDEGEFEFFSNAENSVLRLTYTISYVGEVLGLIVAVIAGLNVFFLGCFILVIIIAQFTYSLNKIKDGAEEMLHDAVFVINE
jgi:hypothetical protein